VILIFSSTVRERCRRALLEAHGQSAFNVIVHQAESFGRADIDARRRRD
jgi:hypothetical protein